MKKIFSIISTVSLLLLFGCKKGDINGAFESQTTGSYVTKVAIGNNIINYSNLAGSKVDVTVKEYLLLLTLQFGKRLKKFLIVAIM
jgi:hypothetical protein